MKRYSLGLLPFLAMTAPLSAMPFVHPGAMSSKAELDFVKAKIAAKAQPWTNSFNQMKAVATPGSTTTAPLDGAENAQKADGRKAYANALTWYFTGDTKYAEQAIGILNVWGKTFKGYTLPPVGQGNQALLDAGWIGALLGPAAEIMRGYSGWSPTDMATVQAMFKSKFYPALNQMSTWNGNVDLTQIDAIMNIAVFNEDDAEFNLGLSRLKKRDSAYFYLSTDRPGSKTYGGSNTSAWNDANGNAPTKWVDGLTQETCRDNTHHAQYAMASAFHAAEVAWHQGVDVYTANTARYTAVLELMSTQIITGNMQGTCLDNVTSGDRFNTFEVGYNHYHRRKGIELPNTLKAITQEIRPKGASDWNIFYETLTHGDLEGTTSISDRSSKSTTALFEVSLQQNGICRIQPNKSESVNLSVAALDGKQLSHSTFAVVEGQATSRSLGLDSAPSGIYLVRIASSAGNTILKYSK